MPRHHSYVTQDTQSSFPQNLQRSPLQLQGVPLVTYTVIHQESTICNPTGSFILNWHPFC